jgi:beta-lactamase class A
MIALPQCTRRRLLTAVAASTFLTGCPPARSPSDQDGSDGLADSRGPADQDAGDRRAETQVSAIEARLSGRLGLAVRDTARGRSLLHHAAQRFPLCSTFKLLLTSAILLRVDQQQESLSRVIPYGEQQLLAYAPVTRAHLREGGLSVHDLCAAAMTFSDNTAANLLLETMGGPAGLTDYLRSWGDHLTRLDRNEPALNEALPGDVRDTTTPAAMLGDLEALLLGSVLTTTSRDMLLAWLVANTTGQARLRAGLPAGWRVGDKTGTGEHGATSDVAIVWPAEARVRATAGARPQPPLLVVAYLVDSPATLDERNGALAELGEVVASWYSAR